MCGLSQDDNREHEGVTELFDKNENDVNHTMWTRF